MDKYQEYENRKQALLWSFRNKPSGITSESYEAECKRIAKELGI